MNKHKLLRRSKTRITKKNKHATAGLAVQRRYKLIHKRWNVLSSGCWTDARIFHRDIPILHPPSLRLIRWCTPARC